jgi:hypothetical protein
MTIGKLGKQLLSHEKPQADPIVWMVDCCLEKGKHVCFLCLLLLKSKSTAGSRIRVHTRIWSGAGRPLSWFRCCTFLVLFPRFPGNAFQVIERFNRAVKQSLMCLGENDWSYYLKLSERKDRTHTWHLHSRQRRGREAVKSIIDRHVLLFRWFSLSPHCIVPMVRSSSPSSSSSS